ncbi:MAG: hypothetical protein QNJ46_12295, partial [Leptolyngbyaceae cyanobacterium MO_188.B28]|nr:hypothetical protein [Leptolyngbyaceae cyanobacterium MO_188.B28]
LGRKQPEQRQGVQWLPERRSVLEQLRSQWVQRAERSAGTALGLVSSVLASAPLEGVSAASPTEPELGPMLE